MKRTYECMCLLDNREVRQGWQALKDAVAGMFTKHGADIVSARRWEERRLAYPVKHQQRGTYLLVYFNGEPEMITPLRRELELSEPVMRNLVL
ncbi:MAG: 30S ribosomal protein S6, partial [Planctomycetota bacterium]